MNDEAAKLRQDLQRYRFLLSANSDPATDKAIRELIAETEARLDAIEGKAARRSTSGPRRRG